jgi:hypothetical protein
MEHVRSPRNMQLLREAVEGAGRLYLHKVISGDGSMKVRASADAARP